MNKQTNDLNKDKINNNENISIKEKVKTSNIFIFCWWIFFLTILYYYDIIHYSLIYTIFGAVLFNINRIIQKFDKIHYTKIIVGLSLEILVLLFNARKHFYVDHKKLFSKKDIIFNIVLFLVYLLFLYVNNLTFNKVYVEISNKKHTDPNENVVEYVNKEYSKELTEIKKRLDNNKEQHFLIEIPNKKRFDETIWNHLNKNIFYNLFL